MSLTRSAVVSTVVLSLAVAGSLSPAYAQAQTRNIYSFLRGHVSPKYQVRPDLTADAAGNLYGNNPTGGTVYRLVPPAAVGQPWTEQTLASLTTATGVVSPTGKLAIDTAGNLYGTSLAGGKRGGGTVWELSPPASPGNSWNLAVLYSFSAYDRNGVNSDGAEPNSGVTMDANGALYGVTFLGGSAGDGVVFQVTPPASGGTTWKETVLHTFTGLNDTKNPKQPLTVSADGRTVTGPATLWYGPTGALEGEGAIYRVRREGKTHTYHRLYLLKKGDLGSFPNGPLVIDGSGNIFGTAAKDRSLGVGTIFELSPPAPGQDWSGKVLHVFHGGDGVYPEAGLITGNSPGTLFGTTRYGGGGGAIDGSDGTQGVVFRFDPPKPGTTAWTLTTLHDFGDPTQSTGSAGDILNGLTFGKNNFLFGIASVAGPHGRQGRVFAQSPH